MVNDILVGIIVPVYNLENCIERTLDSIFAQTYKTIEVIAVDDGSKDKSAVILDKYAQRESRLRVIHKCNEGVSKARFDGIKASHGEYVGFVDGDDTIDSDMFERLVLNAVKYDADISHCGYKAIRETDVKYFYNSGKLIIQNNRQGVFDLLKGESIEPGLWNKMFKRKLFDGIINGKVCYDFSIKNNEDLLMNYYLFKNSEKSIYEDFCPYNYIVRDNSASKGKINEHILLDPAKAAKIIYNDIKGDEQSVAAAGELYAAKLIPTATLYDSGDENIVKSARKSAQAELRKFIPELMKLKKVKKKIKLKALCAAYLPGFYGFVHSVYSKNKC